MSSSLRFYHDPAMKAEVLQGLAIHPDGAYIDCTLGDAGHTIAVLEAALANRHAGVRVLGLDADPEAVVQSTERLAAFAQDHGLPALAVVNVNFDKLEDTARSYGFAPADGILFDLGLSSRQLDAEERGFSFRRPDPLDMRFTPDEGPTAADLVNGLSEEELANVIYRLGEEPRSRRIARAIVANRPIENAQELAEIVRKGSGYPHGRTHPATRTFQALRMAVNHEVESLRSGLHQAARVLRSGGRLVTIAYHSLEDREIKQFLKKQEGAEAPLRALTKKVIKPTKEEVDRNRRARSARMRVAERV